MKFCKDCKHLALVGNVTNCNATAISLIDGVDRFSVDHCSKARGRNGRCGLDGRLYEPVELIETTTEPAQDGAVKPGRKPRTPKAPKETADVQAE